MANQSRDSSSWEHSLLQVIESEVEQLRYLIEDQSGDTEPPDVRAQISRLGGLTDLIFADDLVLSTGTRTAIQTLAHQAEEMVRSGIGFSRPSSGMQLETEQQAAHQMYEAILLNLPYLAGGAGSQYALALSKEAFSSLQRHVGDRADFEVVMRAVLVQDYRVMKLAGNS
ncbi:MULTISPECIES: hypothetical protein [unclassified Pseudomonas]|uniref:hypothetical protein n=1 Tax=unclassified Pseudomonas TaxID=196821 RepID=UPI00244AC2CC|nr:MULTISPECIES: hypothetical protein [unclassified Pseudomonas]MDG9928011.1 hypothetical protein [Pseudomonas sp. GD04042]MDH0482020.1 hypothetical protein [Pseudomonas sp. GD04015]MDH0604085.1 hypothetical protein [Pseudomonas sp. GD03869]